jgi:pimeloyl-[acyl-carrier protein] methyl ester esterase
VKLVLLPGLDGTGELFADFIESLPHIYQVTIVRYPAASFLNYAQLIVLVQAATQSSDPFVLIAESFSTPLAVQFAATRPANLKGLILSTGFVTSPVRGLQRFIAPIVMPLLFRAGLPKFAARYFLVGPRASESRVAKLISVISSVRPNVLSDRLREVLHCDVRHDLGKVTAPILYLQAEQDRLIPARCLEEVLRDKPQIEVARIPGPHLLLQSEPHRAAELVAKFIDQLSGANL